MNATFNIKVSIDSNNVTTSFGSEKIEDMDTYDTDVNYNPFAGK